MDKNIIEPSHRKNCKRNQIRVPYTTLLLKNTYLQLRIKYCGGQVRLQRTQYNLSVEKNQRFQIVSNLEKSLVL